MNLKKFYFVLLFIFLLFQIFSITMAQSIRPIRDNVGFCWQQDEMNMLMKYLSSHADKTVNFLSANLVAAISPHDDYLYAGSVYYPLYKLILDFLCSISISLYTKDKLKCLTIFYTWVTYMMINTNCIPQGKE